MFDTSVREYRVLSESTRTFLASDYGLRATGRGFEFVGARGYVSATDQGAVIVLTTVGESTDARALARTLVEERLAACVNVLPPMTSLYRWKGGIEEDREQQLVIKTLAARVPALEARIRELHSYELPEFLVVTVTGSAKYLAWIEESASGSG